MDETRPAPLVPAGTDLRSFPWLPLPVNFIAGTAWLCASPAARAAMTSLAVASWHQIPAASLPMSDAALASLSQSGQKWRHIKREVLAGWTACSDGRLYHPELAKNAVESMAKKQAQTHRTEAARLALLAKRGAVTESVTGSTGQDKI